MKPTSTQYNTILSWIASYKTFGCLCDNIGGLYSAIQNVVDKEERAKLKQMLQLKKTQLQNKPVFDNDVLLDHHLTPRIFTTRYSAILKIAMLKLLGYDVELQPTGTFYRVRLSEVVPVENFETV